MSQYADPPSRDSNPFSTCWTRPDAMAYWAPRPESEVAAIVDRLARRQWRGQIVGRHGSGKSTLLRALIDPLRARGVESALAEATEIFQTAQRGVDRFLLVEGFERLRRADRRVCLDRLRASTAGFVLTTHGRLLGPQTPAVIARLQPGEDLLAELFTRLVAGRPTRVTLDDARRSHRRRRGNLRAVWFDLYNLHETHRRSERTAPVVASYALASDAR